jgi:putative transposase
MFLPGIAQHVIQRGNNRCDIFRSPTDYEVFLIMLRRALATYPLTVHCYALMSNHVHLMVTPGNATALPRVMQAIGRCYVPYFNRVYERVGGLFQGRYRAMAVDDERYWFTCMRYIELNPVRAGLVRAPDEYRWSSFRSNGLGAADDVLTPHPLYLALGQTSALRARNWRAICGEALPSAELAEMRQAIVTGRLPDRVVFPETAGV